MKFNKCVQNSLLLPSLFILSVFISIAFGGHKIIKLCSAIQVHKLQAILKDPNAKLSDKHNAFDNLHSFCYLKSSISMTQEKQENLCLAYFNTKIPSSSSKKSCVTTIFYKAEELNTHGDYLHAFKLYTLILNDSNALSNILQATFFLRLGIYYSAGIGVKLNIHKSLYYSKKALALNPKYPFTPYVYLIIALDYQALGQYQNAFDNFLKCSHGTISSCQLYLANSYYKGIGTIRSYVQAYAWVNVAIAQGSSINVGQQAALKLRSELNFVLASIDLSGKKLLLGNKYAHTYYANYTHNRLETKIYSFRNKPDFYSWLKALSIGQKAAVIMIIDKDPRYWHKVYS